MLKLLGHFIPTTAEVQTLEEHSEHVAEYCRNFLMQLGLTNCGYIIGILHDEGKGNKSFQEYLKGILNKKIDHAYVGAKYMYDNYAEIPNAFLYFLTMGVMSHHSYLLNFVSKDGECDYLRRIHKEEEYFDESIQNFDTYIINHKDLFKYYKSACVELDKKINEIQSRYKDKNKRTMFYFELGLLGKLLYSALIDADSLDTAQFYNHLPFDQDNNTKRPMWLTYYENLILYLKGIQDNQQINILRNNISKECDCIGEREQGIYRLSVPTGGGKTLASLRFALKHAMKHENIQHIYYVIPYLSILNQSSKTLRDILFPDEQPSYDEFLQHYSNVVVKDEDQYMQYTQRWNSAIILTSMVQFMNALFNGKKQDARRMHQLANAIIIIDEAQSIPSHLLHMFNTAINFLHYVCHSTIVVCTATQPHFQNMEKPILFTENGSLIDNYVNLYEVMDRVNIIDECTNSSYNTEEVAEFVLLKMQDMEQIMIIMNTKKQASEVFEALKNTICDNVTLLHLSTSMCVEHREDTLQAVHDILRQGKPLILISTNMIEAGVDISFPCVIRACAGMDSIIQCAGRCNRNNELTNQKGLLYIVNIREDLSKLKEVEIGKDCTKFLLRKFKQHPENYENRLSSLKIMEAYYQIFYEALKELQENIYDAPFKDNTIYDLLSKNRSGLSKCDNKEVNMDIAFAYEDAGKAFEVIENDKIHVIVPYKNGENIITTLLSKHVEFQVLQDALRQAQRYSVALYAYQIDQLKEACIKIDEFGVMVLNKSNYNELLGVIIEGRSESFFI